jgi:hypothetical protein
MRTPAPGKIVLLGLIACLGFFVAPVRADFITFDPDGLNNPNGTGSLPATVITGFDQAVGNALFVNGNAAIDNFASGGPAAANQFDVYYQATLQGYSGGSPPPPTGINSNFQITFSLRVREAVTSVTFLPGGGALATFAAVTPPLGALDPNYFFRMYYNGAATTAIGNGNLSGLTFQDGRVILDGTPIVKPADTGSFMANGDGTGRTLTDTFDKNGINNYPGVTTIVGNGGLVIDIKVNAVDPSFFISSPTAIQLHLNTSLVLPFDTVDPSGKFRNKDSATSLGLTIPGTLVTPNIGTLNGGGAAAGGGPDLQFQADANASITVPEPGIATLTGLGLAGLLGYGWRKRRQQAA